MLYLSMDTGHIKTLEDAIGIINKLIETVESLREQNAKLIQENAWLKRQIFGSKTERFLPSSEKTGELPGFEAAANDLDVSSIQSIPAHQRKSGQKHGWGVIPEDLPREERIIDIPERERIGLKFIGYDESERIAYRSGLYVIRFKRAKYASPNNILHGVVTAPAVGDFFDTPSGRTKYDVSFIAKIVADKIENSIPLERQAKIFTNDGLPTAPSTLEHLYKNVARSLIPLYERHVKLLMQHEVLHVDETYLKMINKGSGKCQNAYLWCRMNGVGPPMIAFHFAPSRSKDIAEELLGEYSGTIIRDAYVGYKSLQKCNAACCWAHVRRRFYEACEAGQVHAEEPLKMIRALYLIESTAKAKAEERGTETALFQERKKARRTSVKIVRNFFETCRAILENNYFATLLTRAASYALNIEMELRRFLNNPKLNIDNNPAENAIRSIAVGRKNWLFAGNENGGQNLAILFSLAATCKANGIPFRKWLEDVLPRLSSTPAGKVDSLLPHLWLKQSIQ